MYDFIKVLFYKFYIENIKNSIFVFVGFNGGFIEIIYRAVVR